MSLNLCIDSTNELNLSELSREQLLSLIGDLKLQINRLVTDLIKSNSLTKCYQKYFDYINKYNETNELFKSNDKLNQLKHTIESFNAIDSDHCFVSALESTQTQSNGLYLIVVITHYIPRTGVSAKLVCPLFRPLFQIAG